LGSIYFLLPTEKRKRVQNNLSRVLAQQGEDVKSVTKKWCVNKFITRLDFFKFPKMKEGDIGKLLSSIDGLNYLDRALEKGKGAILVTGHFGSNQLIPVVLSLKGYPVSQLGFRTGPLSDSKLDKRIYDIRIEYEEKSFKSIYTGKFLREIFLLLGENRVLVITGDGRQGAKSNFVPLDFLGTRAFFPKGPVVLGSKTGAPLLPTLALRDENWTNKIVIEKPIRLDRTDNKEPRILSNCAKFVRLYESYVHQYPYLWHFWDRFSVENPLGF
jgi:KDO2-lipid IV(A) lauroyltransferase